MKCKSTILGTQNLLACVRTRMHRQLPKYAQTKAEINETQPR